MNLNAGTRLGRYEIRSKIGAGGMGEVETDGCIAASASLSERSPWVTNDVMLAVIERLLN